MRFTIQKPYGCFLYEKDEVLSFRNKPNLSYTFKTNEYEVVYNTNEDGIREQEGFRFNKKGGEMRILTAGDSMTYGLALNKQDTFQERLEKKLSAISNKKIEVIPELITGTDLIPEICSMMNNESKIVNKKVFLLGGFGAVPCLTAEKLQAMVSLETGNGASLQIDHAPFEQQNIIEKINLFSPTMLFVALNHPRAQKWIAENLTKMPSVKLAIGVGGAFDYLSGKTKRASW